jgi:hypothetical protein
MLLPQLALRLQKYCWLLHHQLLLLREDPHGHPAALHLAMQLSETSHAPLCLPCQTPPAHPGAQSPGGATAPHSACSSGNSKQARASHSESMHKDGIQAL